VAIGLRPACAGRPGSPGLDEERELLRPRFGEGHRVVVDHEGHGLPCVVGGRRERSRDLEFLDRQKLAVAGLAAGRYALTIDGQSAATFTAEKLARGVNFARYNTPTRWQAYSVAWSADAGHDLRLVRRSLLAGNDPSLQATADALAARHEADQKARSENAAPKPRKFELVPSGQK
jgi:hypothetical protein